VPACIAIGPGGDIFVSGYNPSTGTTLYRVNPATGNSTVATTLNAPFGSMVDFAYRPQDQKWYGVYNAFSASRFQFIEITNLPEPTALAGGFACAVLRRRRK